MKTGTSIHKSVSLVIQCLECWLGDDRKSPQVVLLEKEYGKSIGEIIRSTTASCPSAGKQAELLGVDRRTLYRWSEQYLGMAFPDCVRAYSTGQRKQQAKRLSPTPQAIKNTVGNDTIVDHAERLGVTPGALSKLVRSKFGVGYRSFRASALRGRNEPVQQ